MIYYNFLNKDYKMNAGKAVSRILRKIDYRLVEHGERVAYIAEKIAEYGNLPVDKKTLYMLCLFHDVGAYKTEEVGSMLEFETKEEWNHSIYGYMFLKYMTPLKESAKAVLYHHYSWKNLCGIKTSYKEYAALIHIADRAEIALSAEEGSLFENMLNNKDLMFNPDYIKIMKECYKDSKFLKSLSDGTYKSDCKRIYKDLKFSAREELKYLKMVIYVIDFKSENTITHLINIVSIALNIGKHFCLSKKELQNIYYGSLFHDVGKIAIPYNILEKSGKLSSDEMRTMKTHVEETENVIRGVVSDEICDIAVRHHEKLDGSGYPRGLKESEITFSQRIVAVSDILSALCSRRSYKEPFSKDKTIGIIKEMSEKQLDKKVCDYVCDNYDSIMEETNIIKNLFYMKYDKMIKEYEKLKRNLELSV